MIDAEILLERIRLKKIITRWRSIAGLLIAAVIAIYSARGAREVIGRDHIATVRITGAIVDDDHAISRLRQLAVDKSVKGVIINIDSGGGSPVAAEMYYHAIKHISDIKPVVGVAGQITASAAYMIAISCDHLISHQYSLVGSIGVVMQTLEITQLAEKLGVKFITAKSSPLKAAPNIFERYTPEVAAVQHDILNDMHRMFSEMVQNERKLSNEDLQKVNTGRLFTGVQALRLRLVDEIGDEQSAISWMENNSGINKKLKAVDYPLERPDEGRFRKMISSCSETLSLIKALFRADSTRLY